MNGASGERVAGVEDSRWKSQVGIPPLEPSHLWT